ncbi:MAG: aldolase [Planctomycetota bacterium]|nr:aldolase [Planctomycetota bacterium]MDA1212469.1 aldolase [Planctomycetota bacterium]
MPNDIRATRRELAAIFRWSHRLGLSEGICNHYSYMVDERHFLINPFGVHWSELKATDLLLVSETGDVVEGAGSVESTALFIHWRIHATLPQAKCVLHTHMPYATALTSLEQGRLEMCCQNSLRFYNDVAYDDDYQGLALDAGEGDRICSKMGGKRILFLANHGVVVVGPNIGVAFDDLYYLERACTVQVIAQSTQQPLKIVDDAICLKTYTQFVEDQSFAAKHLDAIQRILDRESPDYAD